MIEIKKDQWLKEVPQLIYNLKVNYNFYFSGFYTHINRDILEIVKNPKNKHKISIYNRNNRFFLVIYKKAGPDIYYCNDYKEAKQSTINYFMRKFRKSYNKAEADYEEQIYSDWMANSGRIQ